MKQYLLKCSLIIIILSSCVSTANQNNQENRNSISGRTLPPVSSSFKDVDTTLIIQPQLPAGVSPASLIDQPRTEEGASDNPTQEIKKLLDQSRKAHFEGDPDLLVSNSADSIISVNAGKVSISTPAKVKESMSDYLKNTHFIKWDDEMEPIIRFSEDKSMAYAIVRKLVIIKDKKAASSVPPDTSRYAWISVYRKVDNQYKMESIVSTNQ